MSIPQILQNSFGSWIGRNQLWLEPGKPALESDTIITVSPAAITKFVTLEYTWAFDDEGQAGLLLLGADPENNETTAVWVDSWHMRDTMMQCQGQIESDGLINVQGTYFVGDGPDWGWRITLQLTDEDRLKMTMYNISPEGNEDLAVVADCIRQS